MSTLLLGKAIKTGPVNDNSSCEFKSSSVAEHMQRACGSRISKSLYKMKGNQVIQFLMVLLLSVHNSDVGMAAKKPLYFSFITALSGGSTSSGGIPIIDFALEQINNDSRLLPNYTLQYTTVLDSEVLISARFCNH